MSFASINYRFREHASFEDILRDGARAIQTMRARAKEWNIDPRRIGVYGSSAGAIMSLWLAFHNDVGNRNSKDPVLRYSSTVKVVGALLTPIGTQMASRYLNKGDPPVFQYNTVKFADKKNVHHPSHAVALDKKCKQVGVESVLLLKDGDPPFTGDRVAKQLKFFFKHLGVDAGAAKPASDAK